MGGGGLRRGYCSIKITLNHLKGDKSDQNELKLKK